MGRWRRFLHTCHQCCMAATRTHRSCWKRLSGWTRGRAVVSHSRHKGPLWGSFRYSPQRSSRAREHRPSRRHCCSAWHIGEDCRICFQPLLPSITAGRKSAFFACNHLWKPCRLSSSRWKSRDTCKLDQSTGLADIPANFGRTFHPGKKKPEWADSCRTVRSSGFVCRSRRHSRLPCIAQHRRRCRGCHRCSPRQQGCRQGE